MRLPGKVYTRRWYWSHHQEALAKAREWYANHREEARAYRNAHKDRIAEYARTYYLAHRKPPNPNRGKLAKILGHRPTQREYNQWYYRERRATEVIRKKEWFARTYTPHRKASLSENPVIVAQRERYWADPDARLASQIRSQGIPCSWGRGDWDYLCEWYQGRCAYCGRKRRLYREHVVPRNEMGCEHSRRNVVPSCQSCNTQKAAYHLSPFHVDIEGRAYFGRVHTRAHPELKIQLKKKLDAPIEIV
jgi:hypothetical protein